MDFSFDSVATESSNRSLFDYGAGSSSTKAGSSLSHAGDLDVSSFKTDGFSEFTLDLSCLSNPSSPTSLRSNLVSDNGLNILPTPSPSSPLLPPVDEEKSNPRSSPVPEKPSPKPSSMNRATSMMRMSLPAIKYIGRGTPIDPTRRSEWGARKSEDVTEDGMLFSSGARSLDSHTYPHRRTQSVDWQTSPGPRALSPLHMDIDSSLERHTTPAFLEPLPESSKIQIQVDSDPTEWDSVMKTVLGSAGASNNAANPTEGEQVTPSRRSSTQGPVPGLPQPPNGFDIVLGLNSALDLGLGLGKGMNFFDLGLIPDSGRDSPSVYSSAPESPDEETQPPSVEKKSDPVQLDSPPQDDELEKPRPVVSEDQEKAEEEQQQEQHSSEDNVSGSTAAEVQDSMIAFEAKAMRDIRKIHWWQKAVSKLRKVQKFIKPPSRL